MSSYFLNLDIQADMKNSLCDKLKMNCLNRSSKVLVQEQNSAEPTIVPHIDLLLLALSGTTIASWTTTIYQN